MFKLLRFLYDADAPLTSPAAAMAALSSPSAPPAETPKPTETPATPQAGPAPDAKIAEPAAPPAEAKAEPPKPVEQPAPVAEKPWQEVLKSQKPEAIFKELGLDDKAVNLAQRLLKADPKMLNFFDTWENKGDVTSYLEALTVDYTKMEPEDVMRQNLRSQFPKMSDTDFADLYYSKVTERYKQDAENYTPDEVRRGKIELAADSKAIKEALIKSQQERLLPPAPEKNADPRIAEIEKQKAQQEENIANYKKSLFEDQYIRTAINDKKIVVGEGEEAFNLLLPDPDKTLAYLHDGKALGATLVDANGKDDFKKQALISAFATDPYGFIKALGTHFKSLGAKPFADQLNNASVPGAQSAKSEAAPQTAAQAMAQSGTWRVRN